MYNTFIAYLLWLISGCGVLGFHRFYLNKVGTGILYFFTGGLAGIGAFYDFFTLPSQVREANLRIKYERALNLIDRGVASPAMLNDTRIINRRGKSRKSRKAIEQIILAVAKSNNGAVTPSEIALEASISIEQSKKYLDTISEKGYADIRVTKNGTIVYFFPDFAPKGDSAEFEELI